MSHSSTSQTHGRGLDPGRLESVVEIIVDACHTSDDAFEIADEVGRRVTGTPPSPGLRPQRGRAPRA